MKVWWCEEHNSGSRADLRLAQTPSTCAAAAVRFFQHDEPKPCRMVEMQLVPADARMVSENEVVIVIPEGHYLAAFTIAPIVDEHKSFPMKVVSVSDPPKAEEPPKDPWDYDP